jgi:hypothetical protein
MGCAQDQSHRGILWIERESLRASSDGCCVIPLLRGVQAALLCNNRAVGLRRYAANRLNPRRKSEHYNGNAKPDYGHLSDPRSDVPRQTASKMQLQPQADWFTMSLDWT